MNLTVKACAFALIAFSTLPAMAGSRSGPHIIWINLSQNRQIESMIEKRLQAQDDCLAPSASFNDPPAWISLDLVKKAVLRQDKKSISALDRQIRRRYDDYLYDGFDGVMVYDEESGPRVSSLVRGRKYVVDTKLPKQAAAQWVEFCKLVPKISRPN